MTATLVKMERQPFEHVSFLPVNIVCCQMLFYMVETIIITCIENNTIKFQNINSRDSKVPVLYRGSVPGSAIGIVLSIV